MSEESQRRFPFGLRASGAGAAAVAGAAVAGGLRHRAQTLDAESERFRSPLRGHAVAPRSADGTLLHAEVFGADDAPTFVLGPGWTETLYLYDSVTRLLLDRGYRVVAYDPRGQGLSAKPRGGDYNLARYGEDVEAVLATTCDGRDEVIVAGHSMGAMSIAAWAAAHEVKSRINGAALMNTGLDGLLRATKLMPKILPPPVSKALGTYAFLGNPLPFPAFSTGVARMTIKYVAFGPGGTTPQVAFYERMLMTCPPDVRRGAGLAMVHMHLLEALPRLTVPTLVLAGAVDRLTPPSHAKRIAEALPELAELLVLPAIGHMSPLEAPEATVDALLRLHEHSRSLLVTAA
jgi:pimeloyl-ACP methyl ester carboxylesterase